MKAVCSYIFLLFFCFCLALLLTGCSSLDHGPLIEQELRFRPGYQGLTHSTCLELFNGDCLRQDIVTYDFSKESDLKRLRDIKLICKVGDKRFHVCEDKAALCSNSEETKEFMGIIYSTKLVTEILYVPEDLQTLLDSAAYCAAQDSVSEKGMF